MKPQFTNAPRQAPNDRWEGIGFRADLQGLRAVAVALVLLSHAGLPFAEGGYVGVDVFFVLSGFLITSLLVKEFVETGKLSIAGFYARRARRILPAASLVAMATVAGAWLWFPVTRLEAVMQDAFTVIVYVINYRLIAQESDYLNADQMPSPFQQYWSLAVEEQFYVVWPLLLLALLLLVKRDRSKFVNAGIGLAAGVFAVGLVLSVLITEESRTVAYYAAHTRVWELAAGALLALTLPTLRKTPAAASWILGIAGLAAILASGFLFTRETPFPGYAAMLPVIGAMLLIIAGSGAGWNPASTLLGTAPFQFFGKISYSLYLWHWPILILVPLAVGVRDSLLLNLVLLVMTVAVAQASYLYVEEPIRRGRTLRSGNLWGLGTGVVCSVLSIIVIVTFTVGFAKVPEDTGPVNLETIEEFEPLTDFEQRLVDGLAVESVPEDLVPSLAGVLDDKPEVYRNGCHLGFDEVELPDGCWIGNSDAETTVVLLGDSHAAQWLPTFQAIAEEHGWGLLTRTKSACTPVSVSVFDNEGNEYGACDQWRQEVFDELKELEPDLLVISTSDNIKLVDDPDGEASQLWEQGWTDTLAAIGDAPSQTVALTDTPLATGDSAADCLALPGSTVQGCQAEPYIIAHEGRRYAAQVAQETAGIEVIDSEQWFCYQRQCPIIVENILVYRDGNHMTTVYAKSLAGVVEAALPPVQ